MRSFSNAANPLGLNPYLNPISGKLARAKAAKQAKRPATEIRAGWQWTPSVGRVESVAGTVKGSLRSALRQTLDGTGCVWWWATDGDGQSASEMGRTHIGR